MPFKSAKLSLVKCILRLCWILGFAFQFLSYSANATVTVYPVSPYELDDSNVLNFAVTGVDFVDAAKGFRLFDYTISGTDSDPDPYQMILLDVESTNDFADPASGEKLVISVFAQEDGSSNDNFKVVPIAAAKNFENFDDEDADMNYVPAFCEDGVNCQAESSGLFYAARYTEKKKWRIGLYLKDLCAVGGLKGCNGSNIPATSSSEKIELRVAFAIVGSSTYINDADIEANNIGEIGDIDIGIQSGNPSYYCGDLSDFYFPGDGRIFVNSSSGIDIHTSTNLPQIKKLVIVADSTTDSDSGPDTTFEFGTSGINDVVARVDISTTPQTVTGFVNSTNADSVPYDLIVGVRDYSGAVTFNSSGCSITNLEVAEINGFLNDNGCFMATATFQVRDNPQLSMLRDFRDHFLKKFWLGRRLIDFYYSWSPGASLWLIKNSWLRPTILALLIPIQIFAYFALHPILFLALVVCLLGMIASLGRLRRREQ